MRAIASGAFEIWKSDWAPYGLTGGSGNGWSAYWMGKYRLTSGTAGHNDGVVIPNFNDGFFGSAPDRGTHEDGTPDMGFGPGASGS